MLHSNTLYCVIVFTSIQALLLILIAVIAATSCTSQLRRDMDRERIQQQTNKAVVLGIVPSVEGQTKIKYRVNLINRGVIAFVTKDHPYLAGDTILVRNNEILY